MVHYYHCCFFLIILVTYYFQVSFKFLSYVAKIGSLSVVKGRFEVKPNTINFFFIFYQVKDEDECKDRVLINKWSLNTDKPFWSGCSLLIWWSVLEMAPLFQAFYALYAHHTIILSVTNIKSVCLTLPQTLVPKFCLNPAASSSPLCHRVKDHQLHRLVRLLNTAQPRKKIT